MLTSKIHVRPDDTHEKKSGTVLHNDCHKLLKCGAATKIDIMSCTKQCLCQRLCVRISKQYSKNNFPSRAVCGEYVS